MKIMYKVEYLPSALRDLTELANYIGVVLGEPQTADALAERIVTAAEKLAELPYMYPVYETIRPLKNEYRRFVVGNYSVFYHIDEKNKCVTVSRVIYSGRDIDTVLS